jgi:hypothetical protein
MAVTKERFLCPHPLKKADGGHKREGFVTANIKRGRWRSPRTIVGARIQPKKPK